MDKVNPTDVDSSLVIDSSKNYYADINSEYLLCWIYGSDLQLLNYLSIEAEHFSWPYPIPMEITALLGDASAADPDKKLF